MTIPGLECSKGREAPACSCRHRRKDPATGDWLKTFAIITTDPNEVTAKVHTRMPVILHARDHDRWLMRGLNQPPVDLLRLYEAEAMTVAACNPLVGDVRNNGPEMLNSE